MKSLIILLVGTWLAGAPDPRAAWAQGEGEAPAYVNAEIVRVNQQARTLVYRDGSGEKTVAVDGAVLPGLSRLRRGDKVILTSRVVRFDEGETRVVTEVRSAASTPGEPADRTPTAKERTLGPLRVVGADAGARLVTVTDAAGVTQVLPVRGEGERELARLRVGDVVVLSVGPEPGVAGNGDVVLRIRRVDGIDI